MLTPLIGQRSDQRTARIKTGFLGELKRNIVVADNARRVEYFFDASDECSRVVFLKKAAKAVQRCQQTPGRDPQIMDRVGAGRLPPEPQLERYAIEAFGRLADSKPLEWLFGFD